MGSKLISNQANRANNSPRANRDHGSRPLLARRQGRFWFYLQSGQQPAQPCCIWEHDPTTALGKRRVQIALDAQPAENRGWVGWQLPKVSAGRFTQPAW